MVFSFLKTFAKHAPFQLLKVRLFVHQVNGFHLSFYLNCDWFSLREEIALLFKRLFTKEEILSSSKLDSLA